MKKITAMVLCLILVVTSGIVFAACSKKEPEKETTTTTEAEQLLGGWTTASSPEITKDFKKVFEKAMEGLTGVNYTPVAYLASQVVAGTNHCVLCKAETVVPNATPTYAIVYIYEDLNGNAEVSEVVSSDLSAETANNDGGWSDTESPAMTDEAKAALDKATEALTGAEYKPVALLATQVVAGTNYRIVCEAKPTVPNAEAYYVIVTVGADLNGNAEILETTEFE